MVIVIVLLARLVSVAGIVGSLRLVLPQSRGAIRILTWGGLRGGISIAMALSLPSGDSRNLLQFAYSTRRAAGKVEVFCFGTRLSRITRQLDRRRPDEAMAAAAQSVFDWDGGTRIGDSLAEFVRTWGRRGLARGGIVVICSDGLDRGDPETLATAMERLSRCCHRIVWLNPHLGDGPGRELTSMGMMVAEPYVDEIMSGHSLQSLENFARALPALS